MADKSEDGAIGWMANNHVAANLLMLTVLIGGFFVMLNIKQEVFPEFALDYVDVSVSYPGASPEEVEEGIILAIEEVVRPLEGVESVTATAKEGRAVVTLEYEAGADPNKSLQDVNSAVDSISSMPEDAEKPKIKLRTRRRPVLQLALSGPLDERTLFYFAQGIRDDLIALDTVTQVEIRGARKPEISVEVPLDTLRSYGLTLGGIAAAIRNRAVDVPAGGVKTRGGEILIRTSERRDFASEYEGMALITSSDGTVVKLGDIAKIIDGFADSEREAYFDGKRAILFYIYQTGDQKPLEISESVREYVKSISPTLPESVKLAVYNDRSDLYRQRLNLLLKNGGMGLALVLLTLGLFLEARLAFWVAMGIPISILGSFVLLPMTGASLNMISLFAFIITLGIIVDDAVVVGESVHYYRRKGLAPLPAAIRGTKEMSLPVTFAVITNIVAFMPLLFVPGTMGRFFSILPAVIITVFLISLIECMFILPAHLNFKRRGPSNRLTRTLGIVPAYCTRGMEIVIERWYLPFLRLVVARRYATLAISLAVLSVAFAYMNSGHISFSFRPRIQTDRIDAEVTLPYGAPIEEVRRVAKRIEQGGLRAIKKAGGMKILDGRMIDVGRRGSNTAEVRFYLVPQNQREITTKKFSVMWRKEVGNIPGLESLFFDYLVGPGGSSAINMELTHPDPRTLEMAATDLARALAEYDGVTDINDGYAQGKTQLDFKMKSEGQSLGLNARDLGSQVRHAFYGAEALRQQRGRHEVKVMVRLPESERKSIYDIEEFLIRIPGGGEIPLNRAVTVTSKKAYTEIKRVDGARVLNVTANVVPGVANENRVIDSLKEEVLDELFARYPGLKYSFSGRQKEQRKAMRSMMFGSLTALLVIFSLLAILFRSYTQSIMVMFSIFFGIASALGGHILMGYNLSVISVFGMIALCGVVINGGLVLTVTANRMRDAGDEPAQAAINAGLRRFRPIVLTAVTTFLGLAPMIFETSVQARFLIPMAISLGYGILFSTVVILFLMPALYTIQSDLKNLFKPVSAALE